MMGKGFPDFWLVATPSNFCQIKQQVKICGVLWIGIVGAWNEQEGLTLFPSRV